MLNDEFIPVKEATFKLRDPKPLKIFVPNVLAGAEAGGVCVDITKSSLIKLMRRMPKEALIKMRETDKEFILN